MSGAGTSTFRLLDGGVGWDPRPGDGLAGVVVDDGGLRLAPGPAARVGAPGTAALATARWPLRATAAWWLGRARGTAPARPVRRRLPALGRRYAGCGPSPLAGRRVAVVLAAGEVVESSTPRAAGVLAAGPGAASAVTVALESRRLASSVADRHGLRTELDPSGLVCRAEVCRPGDAVPAHAQHRAAGAARA